MIEDDPNQKLQSKRKTYAPLHLVEKPLTQHKLKCQYMRKNSFPYISHLKSLDTLCGEVPSQS